MQQPRVTPRNIQFNDTIHIREIPRYSQHEMTPIQTDQQEPWNPNLANTKTFNEEPSKLKYIVIGIVVGGLVLIGVIIGVVVGVILSGNSGTPADNSLSYNEACTTGSNQCISSQGLSCVNGFCSCSSPYSWNTITKTCTLLTYNQACTQSNQCNSSLGLNCTSGLCKCDSYHSWDSTTNNCTFIYNNTLSFGATCLNGSSQCNSSVELTCTGNCTCRNSKVWNVSSCVCPAGTFLNSSNLCQTALLVNQSCTVGSNQCDSTKNLVCNSSRCQCDYSIHYWNINFQSCMTRLNYSQQCSSDSDCRPTFICPSISGVCNCSQLLPDYVCNCPNTKYYDSTTFQCVNRASFGGSCSTSANYTCLISLYCNGGTCACPSGTVWVAGNSTCAATG